MAIRVWVRIPEDVQKKLVRWSEKLGVHQSQLGGMALQTGLDQLLRTIDPISSLSEEELTRLVEFFEAKGLKLDVSEVKKDGETK